MEARFEQLAGLRQNLSAVLEKDPRPALRQIASKARDRELRVRHAAREDGKALADEIEQLRQRAARLARRWEGLRNDFVAFEKAFVKCSAAWDDRPRREADREDSWTDFMDWHLGVCEMKRDPFEDEGGAWIADEVRSIESLWSRLDEKATALIAEKRAEAEASKDSDAGDGSHDARPRPVQTVSRRRTSSSPPRAESGPPLPPTEAVAASPAETAAPSVREEEPRAPKTAAVEAATDERVARDPARTPSRRRRPNPERDTGGAGGGSPVSSVVLALAFGLGGFGIGFWLFHRRSR